MLNFFFSLLPTHHKPRKPRNPNLHKYRETTIYEIRAIQYPDIFYIGHSVNPHLRFEQHKNEATTGKNQHLKSRYMRLIGVHNFTFKVICKFSCRNRAEAEAIEARYIQRHNPPMNTEFVTLQQIEVNETKYAQFAGQFQFSPFYTLAREMLRFVGIL